MITVLVAEDSVTILELLVHILTSDPGIEVIGTARNGSEAVQMTTKLRPDVIVMDINMPVMNGFEATKEIMISTPTPIVIVSATMNVREVSVSMAALDAGAVALHEKPVAVGATNFAISTRQFVSTVKAMADVKVVRHWRRNSGPCIEQEPKVVLSTKPRMIAIAASTGGPAALGRILSALPANFPLPILVVQHLAKGFVSGLASWLNSICSLNVKVAVDKDPLNCSTVYLAPDDVHLGVSRDGFIQLDRGEPIEGFRPSATHLFKSVSAQFGSSAVGLTLTGMGRDGTEGLQNLRNSGGHIIVQDEQTSVVYGMPKSAIEAGLADAVLPLDAIAGCLLQLTGPAKNNGSYKRR